MSGNGCAICWVSTGAGEVVEKKVEKVVRGGCNAAVLTIEAGVCTKCGERYCVKEIHEKIQKSEKSLSMDLLKHID